jgi:hypothetical protein
MKIDNVLKHSQKGPKTTVKKKEGEHQGARNDNKPKDVTHDLDQKVLQSITTLFTPTGDESETGEKKDDEVKVAHLMKEKRRAMKTVSARERHEVMIKELERKVEQLSGQVQSLQEENHGLRKYTASLDTKLRKANDAIDVISSRAVYILRRFHLMYRSQLERHEDMRMTNQSRIRKLRGSQRALLLRFALSMKSIRILKQTGNHKLHIRLRVFDFR